MSRESKMPRSGINTLRLRLADTDLALSTLRISFVVMSSTKSLAKAGIPP